MRNTILSISAFGLAALAAGYTIAMNPPEFLQQKNAPEQVGSTYSFGTLMTSGSFYADKTGLSYAECQGMLREEASGGRLRSGLNYVCTPEDGDGLTYTLAFTKDSMTLFEGMTLRDCEISKNRINAQAIDHDPSAAAPMFCIPEAGTSYSTSLTWRLRNNEGYSSQLVTRDDCEATLAILDEARLAGSGSGLIYRCVEGP